ncbi:MULTISPECIES: methyl-accepting chemotaxis protein [unclassified Rhizobium]|uniref:methyl-accepting chemotaxis protein n=1 Tax=Agrobacterium pusense TaxID=648995 RepID=UPI00051377D8|nr:chemotaxis protein [Rhizobium sp. H41]
MKNLSLKAVLTGLMATLLVAIVALSATSLRSINTMKASTQEIGNYWFERIVTAREVKGAFADLRLAYSRYAMVSDDAEFQAEAQRLSETKQHLADAIAKYEARLSTETGKAIAEKVKVAVQEYMGQGSRYTELVRIGNRAGASDLFHGTMKTDADQVNAEIQELVAYITQRADENVISAEVTADSAFLMTLAVASVAVIVSLIGMYLATARIAMPIQRITDAMRKLAGGDIESTVPFAERRDEIGAMAAAVQVFRENAIERIRLERETEANRSISEKERIAREEQKAREATDVKFAVDNLATGLAKLSDGDISFRIRHPFVETLDAVRMNFNHSAEKLQGALINVAQNARGIDAGANEIKSAADDLAKRTEQQAAAVEETAAALEQITTTVKDSTKRAQEAGALVGRTKAGAEESGNVVRSAVVAMEQIAQSANEINNIIGVIDEIAFQTNLLALNAGVEAARAGDAGKGFAVVAQEVRELAQRSANAAKEIKALITTSNQHVSQGVQLVGNTGKALETIVSEVQEINLHVAAIVEAAQEQSSGLQQINTAVNQMDQDTQKNAAMVEESTAASHGLAREAASLNQLLAQFKLSDDNRSAANAPVRSATSNDRPAASPVRALGRKIASAFSGNAAVDTSKDAWEEF